MRRFLALILALAVLWLILAPAVALGWPGGPRPLAGPDAALGGGPAPQAQSAESAQRSDGPASACTVAISETVGFDPLRLCDHQPVTVTLGLSCPTWLPLHIVFVVGNHLAMQADLEDAKRAARDILNGVPWHPGSKAGLVTLSTQARRDLELTENRGTVTAAIGRIQLDPINPFTEYYDWIGTARQMLEEGRRNATSPLEVIVVFSTGCPTGFEDYCSRQTAAASRAKGAGMWLAGVCNPNARPFGFPLPANHCRTLQQMSSQGYYRDLRQAARVTQDLTGLSVTGSQLRINQVTLTEVLAGGLSLEPSSAAPVPGIRGPELTFVWRNLAPGTAVTASYKVEAATLGRSPLRTTASNIVLVDSLNRTIAPATVPTRTLNVVSCEAPTPTPTEVPPPTATATPQATDTPVPSETPPPTATVTATATPRPARLVLPLLFRGLCRGGRPPADIILAIDTSRSMDETAGGLSKLAAAQGAARRFLTLLEPGRDHLGVVAFNTETRSLPLTADLSVIESFIAGLDTQPGTRIDRALVSAAELLGAGQTRPDSSRVIVLLTDGHTEAGSADAAINSATAARADGVQIYAIGLGDEVDEGLLRQLASGPAFYLHAPGAADLAAVYERIAADLPCPGGSVLGRP